MSTAKEIPRDRSDDLSKGEPAPGDGPAEQAEKLEAKVEAVRDDLGALVSELDRRRQRVTKSLARGAVAVAVIGVGGYVLWRALQRWSSARVA
jgi:hypothetical protein